MLRALFQCGIAHVGVEGLGSLFPVMVPTEEIFPVATVPMTLLAKSPPFATEDAYMFPPIPVDTADTNPPGPFPEDFSVTVLAVAVRMALFVT